jgi:hypothetical protein
MRKQGRNTGLRFRRHAIVEFGFSALLVDRVEGLDLDGPLRLAPGYRIITHIKPSERQNRHDYR